MVIRQRDDLTQIAVLEDKVLVEHYVARESQTSLIGNVYLGRVQNVLPSMEAAFVDIGKGRNAVLYAGEVNWEAFGAKDGNQRKIEQVLKPGQPVLVQVTKDPIGHKGARLTSQISLPGRFLVYVPAGSTSGISRKLPEGERNRLKTLLKEIVPDSAGVIVRTAAEGASEDELTHDVARLTARWEDIEKKVESGKAPRAALRRARPDPQGRPRPLHRGLRQARHLRRRRRGTWCRRYVDQVAPDLAERLEKHDDTEADAFTEYRIDEQIAKALERKVWLPSGGSLVIDRTEAMTVVDVNTGKFTGSGGNLEETVTKNNLEAAEEIVRQLRLRDIGGIIVVDFIDMVLESNRDLVLRRLIECLGRDRTRHQVAEVTSLGLVQMTRKRIGTGLLEAFSESCEHCQGRGLVLHTEPVESKRKAADDEPRKGGRRSRGADARVAGRRLRRRQRVGLRSRQQPQRPLRRSSRRRGRVLDADPAPSHAGGVRRHGAGREGRARRRRDGCRGAPAPSSHGPPAPPARSRLRRGATAPRAARKEPTTRRGRLGGRSRRGCARGELGERPPDQPAAGRPTDRHATASEALPESAEPERTSAGHAGRGVGDRAGRRARAEPVEPPPAPPAAPRIVTSTRRIGARRAAGPPAGSSAATAAAERPTTAPTPHATRSDDRAGRRGRARGDLGGTSRRGVDPAHVPVKKKGTRKR